MLGLQMATDPRWAKIAEDNIEEILTDHAWCEQKAATNAISMLIRWYDLPELVEELGKIAKEEIEHFNAVLDIIKKRGLKLGPDRKDDYVNDLLKFQKGGNKTEQLVDRLLFAAMIEARSCERFKMLSEKISDPELKKFYRDLMESEANHYTVFIGFARKYGKGIDVDKKWKAFLAYEAELMKSYGKSETIHG